MNTEKFIDNKELVYDFGEEFLVECPKCKSLAKVLPLGDDSSLFAQRRIICLNCGMTKDWKGKVVGWQIYNGAKEGSQNYLIIGGNFDWYFQEQLWLQIECCNETLWAYNERHLRFIENYVAAKLRQRIPNINKSLTSRLPKWMKQAKNRAEILKAIEKLKEKLNGKY